MNSSLGSISIGTRIAAATICAVMLLPSPTASAQESQARAFDDEVLNFLLESRNQKPASQATAQERESAVDELTNIYLVSELPRAVELGEGPRIGAQLELQRRVLLFNAFTNDFLASNEATEQEILDVYEKTVALSAPKEFKASHILVESQGAAVALIEDLQEGADFAELAKKHSTGPSSTSGGDLGWFTVKSMVEPFSDAVADLDDGAFTMKPVQTQYGWHVILRVDSRDSPPPPLESVRDVIKQNIGQQKLQEFMSNLRSKVAE